MKHSWVEINLEMLGENIRHMRSSMRRDTEIIFVVKANAYGHGLRRIVQCAADHGVRWFGVAYVEEAIVVREVVSAQDVLILGVAGVEDVPVLLGQRLTPMVVSLQHGQALGDRAASLGKTLPVHLKIDTGMGRLGFAWEDAAQQASVLLPNPGLDIRGICTHFAAVKPTNLASAEQQMGRFSSVASAVERLAGRKLFRHVSSSRALLYVDDWDMDGVRPGIALYGYGTKGSNVRINTFPVLQWKTRVIQVKSVPANFPVGYYGSYITPAPTKIATLSIGYADGYPRLLSNKGCVLIRGRRCPVVGRVSMNWVTIDVGLESEVAVGDEVALIGEQGAESIWADDLAHLCQTIPYEILTDINPTLERRYIPR